MKPMLPSLSFEIPQGDEWMYEVKYDGFRAVLDWNSELTFSSRNGNPLIEIFPELSSFLKDKAHVFKEFLPLTLDGELVFLENDWKANFGILQTRGRMRSKSRIKSAAEQLPCRYLVFDLLKFQGKDTKTAAYLKRKEMLTSIFQKARLPMVPNYRDDSIMQMVPCFSSFENVWDQIVLYGGEGVVAKHKKSRWEEGKRTSSWIKFKNWKYISCFITSFEKSNGYFYTGVYRGKEIVPVGHFLFGLKPEEKRALFQIIRENKIKEDDKFIYVEPAICVEIKYLEFYDNEMREPHFHKFLFDVTPQECTYDKFVFQQKNLPKSIEITHPEKPLWETPNVRKMDFIHYLREVSPYLLPFLQNRLLTVIRYPHGIFGEAFFQKNCPDYAPEFVERKKEGGIEYIVCNNLKTLLWLGNQLSLEFHIPFQTVSNPGPGEIVFDLDPPSKESFHLAVKAALMIKEVLDRLELISFVKTSGNKGLQIYVPLPDNTYSFDDTRLFTSFIADYLVTKDPDSFTIERMKKKRGNRLYVDYVQHSENKTIIAPFSPRGNQKATVAAPLYWKEVNENLKVENFQITNILQRIKKEGNPFSGFFRSKKEQNFTPVLHFLRKKDFS